jgi:type IV secretory pathway TrbF-like protein
VEVTTMTRGTAILAGSCLALAATNFPAWAPAQVTLTPRVILIDQVKCAELLSRPGEGQDRLLLYFNGYVDGMQRQTTWDERVVGARVERAVGYCKADPTETVLSAFTRASR